MRQQGTLHFRFGQLAGKIDLADVRVRDVQTGEDLLPPGSFDKPSVFAATWHTWPPPSAITVGKWEVSDGALHVTLVEPPNGRWPDFHFHSVPRLGFRAGRTYRCTFRARATPGRAIQPALYQIANGTWNHIGGPPGPFLSQVALARDAGVNLVSFSAPNCWSPPESPADWSPIDSLCRRIIFVNPEVLLVPRVGVDAPGWWLERHPQSRMVYDLDKVRADHASVSDRTCRADAAAHLERLCRHLCEAFPRHFAGIHPCGQNTGEWFYLGSWERPLSGYDAATVAAFRVWLKSRGRPDSEAAMIPTDEERRGHPFGFLRDPAREQRLIDFARFQQIEMADHVVALAAACRRATAGITRVWCWAPGSLYPDRQDVAGIPEVAGFKAHPVTLPSAEAAPTEEGRRRGLTASFGPRTAIQPLFAVEAHPEETWATYADGSVAVAARRHRRGRGVSGTELTVGAAQTGGWDDEGGWDVFVGTPRLTPELLRALAKLAGIHLFTEANVPVWAAEGYLAIQAHAAGPVTVDVGRAVPVFDALDDTPLGHGPRVRVPFKQGETRVLKY
ncbi:MAG: hypothetical protein JXQ71_13495 [Verrucomicrobia bacterium]|nr:hypothetical protein [Verrucomicrobiota bacterium]